MSTTSFLPFLYQTRTILRAPRVSVAHLRTFHATGRSFKGNEIPFASEVGEVGEEGGAEPAARSTITPTERQIFERIFADIQARGAKHVDVPRDDPVSPPPPTAARSAMLIMQQAAEDSGQARPATVAPPGLLAGAAKDRNKALLRFPPELRAAAARALNAIDPSAPVAEYSEEAPAKAAAAAAEEEEQWKAPAHTFMRKFELDAKRLPERRRVEGLITSAKTDRELWDVLEKEVFTMPARMGLVRGEGPKEGEETAEKVATEQVENEGSLEAAASSEDEGHSMGSEEAEAEVENTASKSTAAESETPEGTESSDPSEEMSLYIHGPLYPAYLLLAIRRLGNGFRTTSPLTLNMLPRIKEIGLESYVLGVSTPFYNELLEIYWSRYGDLAGMLNLLEEMRHCGLYFDNQTSSVLAHVQASLNKLSDRKESSFCRAIMTMPQYESSVRERIRHWHRVVDISIEQRGEDIGY
ncbi:hypothetical protein SLS62_000571 [Diatrype stigma]|uniref:Mtf2-like C-terminal domain-containing protein n=1 Tax=Diatrype stigma TaxID=117547 RepID=A0AAN9V104_9PEZI